MTILQYQCFSLFFFFSQFFLFKKYNNHNNNFLNNTKKKKKIKNEKKIYITHQISLNQLNLKMLNQYGCSPDGSENVKTNISYDRRFIKNNLLFFFFR